MHRFIRFQHVRKIVTFSCATAAFCLTGCASKDQIVAPDISYPGLSVYGLGEKPAAEVFTNFSAAMYLYRHDTIPDAGFISFRAVKNSQRDSVQQRIDYRLAQAPLDTCMIITDGDGHSKARYQGSPSRYVDVGPMVTVDRPGTSALEIMQSNKNNKYRLNNLSGPLPTGASLSISSDDFPVAAAYKVSDTEPPVAVTPNSGTWVNVDTKYTWEHSNEPSSYIEILFYSKGRVQWPKGYGMRCDVIDDGEFKLPKKALELVRRYENSLKVGYFRINRRMDYQNGILFYQKATAVGDLSRL